MTATVSVTESSMELTPQRVTLGGVDLGGTLDNVVVDFSYSKGEIKADQFGTTVLDRRVNGIAAKVTLKIAQVRDAEVWSEIFPNANYADVGGDKAIEFRLPIGASDLDNAVLLNLHPVVVDDSDVSQDHNFYLAFPEEVSQITYGPEEQSGLQMVFNVYRQVTGGVSRWYRFGDPTVVVP